MNNIRERTKLLPDTPGVYMMKDGAGKVIYIGKAASLRQRVRSYFTQQAGRGPRLAAMVNGIGDIDYIACASEVEALILECSLIKKHMPRYNVRFRDDKKYPYIRLSGDAYPGVQLTRSPEADGSGYFGPFTDAHAARKTVKTLARVFMLRTCAGPLKHRIRPCLYYHLAQCSGPCAGKIAKEDYLASAEGAQKFLAGRGSDLIQRLSGEMSSASRNRDYERAASLRDKISALERVSEKQDMESTSAGDEDYVSFARGEEMAAAGVISVREGRVVRFESFPMDSPREAPGEEILSSFIKQIYATPRDVPASIFLPAIPEDAVLIEKWLGTRRRRRVRLYVPRRGRRRALLEKLNANLALKSAEAGELARKASRNRALLELASLAGLPSPPGTIYCFDAAHISGTNAAGAAVVFKDGFPSRAAYRRFRLRGRAGDDAAMVGEIVHRRFRRALEEGAELPGLVVVDGGSAQAGAARAGLAALGLSIPVIGLAKKKETVYLEDGVPVNPPADAPCLVLLKHLRDEAHRTATAYHARRRDAAASVSVLDRVRGLGPRGKLALLRKFGDTGYIASASEEQLREVPGIGPALAARIKEVLHDAGSRQDGQACGGLDCPRRKTVR